MERGVLQELFFPVHQNTFRSDALFVVSAPVQKWLNMSSVSACLHIGE